MIETDFIRCYCRLNSENGDRNIYSYFYKGSTKGFVKILSSWIILEHFNSSLTLQHSTKYFTWCTKVQVIKCPTFILHKLQIEIERKIRIICWSENKFLQDSTFYSIFDLWLAFILQICRVIYNEKHFDIVF